MNICPKFFILLYREKDCGWLCPETHTSTLEKGPNFLINIGAQTEAQVKKLARSFFIISSGARVLEEAGGQVSAVFDV